MNYPKVFLKSGKEFPIRNGHPWIFSRAIKSSQTSLSGFVEVVSNKSESLGVGFYNEASQIRVRMLSRNLREIDRGFVSEKLYAALERRKSLITGDTTAYRWIYSEADGLPGIILDRYGDFAVLQCHTASAEALRPDILSLLESGFNFKGIIERSDLDVRHMDGLEHGVSGVVKGCLVEEKISVREQGMTLIVDLDKGQKTGFFLDQRENRERVFKLSNGKEVLNLYSFSGASSVAALLGGANKVTSVDIDADALELLEQNLTLNNITRDKHQSICEDVKSFLRGSLKAGDEYDLVILDPPAFAKHRRALKNALQAYKEINSMAMKLVKPGGYLLSSSCSGLVTKEMFKSVLIDAGRMAKRVNILLGEFSQPNDHPLLPAFPEGEYLKTSLLQVSEVLA